MSTPQKDLQLILDIVKFLQLQPDIPQDINQYCASKWGESEKQYKTYIDFLLYHSIIQPTPSNDNLYIPTLKGINITQDELGALVNNHERVRTPAETYLVVSKPLPLKISPTITP